MEADIKSLEAKITKLVDLCTSLREENAQLNGELAKARSNMRQASDKLEVLLGSIPQDMEASS
jgi:cell division protein ZapB